MHHLTQENEVHFEESLLSFYDIITTSVTYVI